MRPSSSRHPRHYSRSSAHAFSSSHEQSLPSACRSAVVCGGLPWSGQDREVRAGRYRQPASSTPPGTSAAGSYGVRVKRNEARSRCEGVPSAARTTRNGSPV